jgi:hypothetical protein
MSMKKNRLLGSHVPAQKPTPFEDAYRGLKSVRRIVVAIAGIVAAVHVIAQFIGPLIIQIYLLNFTILISPAGTLSKSSLEIFVVFLLILLGGLVGLVASPMFTTSFVAPETRDALPNLFGLRFMAPDTPRPMLLLKRITSFDFLKEYVMLHFPSLSLILIIMPVDAYFNMPIQKMCSWAMPVLFLASASLLYIFKLKRCRLKFSTYIDLIINLTLSNCMAMIWMSLLEILVFKAWQHGVGEIIGPKEKVVVELIAVAIVGIFCHALMVTLMSSIRALAGLAVLAVGVLCIYPGPAALAAAALREAQLGGGTRISYAVMGARATTPEPANGCLVLATPVYVAIELDNNSCSLPTRFAFTGSDMKGRPVQVFSRSEVNIIELPSR